MVALRAALEGWHYGFRTGRGLAGTELAVEAGTMDLEQQIGAAGDHRICCALFMRRLTSGSLVASAFIQRVDLSCCFSDRMADLVAIDPLVANCGGLRLIGRPSHVGFTPIGHA